MVEKGCIGEGCGSKAWLLLVLSRELRLIQKLCVYLFGTIDQPRMKLSVRFQCVKSETILQWPSAGWRTISKSNVAERPLIVLFVFPLSSPRETAHHLS